jgi:hypothetical protein
LQFAQGALGTMVGQGQCTDLAIAAFSAAGARSFSVLGPSGPNDDYVWGTPVATLNTGNRTTAGILPGDVIQFRDASFMHVTHYANGSTSWSTWTASHHTAIVVSVSGSTINLIQQNAGDSSAPVSVRETVQLGSIDMGDIQSGTMWVYRPIAV